MNGNRLLFVAGRIFLPHYKSPKEDPQCKLVKLKDKDKFGYVIFDNGL